ncbi:hypothetical protein [Pontibaca salina]|uniref:Sulfotransferase domain-containing protein n=1 Tax=Pontibaca salina TaxID=2795731 RepID=A0A934HUU2_9RHOB|nr:hypothetical protein [Pontibaca salina]MBI6630653.1 hypothetical protein [Pontibaca salina]
MKLVCHIGTPKTASTFLQNTMVENRDWLQQNGVIYPDLLARSPNHITLFYAASEQIHDFAREYGLKTRADVLHFREKIGHALDRQISDAPKNARTMLVSSENLTGNQYSIQNLRDLFCPRFDDIKIVVYLRRQDDAILSMYGEYMRKGFNGMSFPEFVSACLGKGSPTPYLYYRRMLSSWINIFGKPALEVRLFDRAHLAGGDILRDFMTVVFGSDLPDLSQIRRAAQDNTGLAAPVLEFLHRMYPYIPRRKNDALNMDRIRLGPRIDALPATPRPQMAPDLSQKIMEHFRPANSWLRKTFFPEFDGPVFPDRRPGDLDSNMGQISLAQFAEYTGHLFT